jgi:hypothetical protein
MNQLAEGLNVDPAELYETIYPAIKSSLNGDEGIYSLIEADESGT